MIPAHDSLRAIQDAGAADFDSTRLAGDLSAVVRPVRRHRAVRATVGTAAGVAAVGAVALWNQQYRAQVMPAEVPVASAVPSETPTPTPSSSPSTTPATTAPAISMTELVVVGERIEWTITTVAETYGESEAAVREALIAALPAEANGDPEGWVSPIELPAPATMEEAAALLVQAQVQNLEAMGVPREDWLATLTIASILVKESPDPHAWPDISQVIHNRLEADMRLDVESPLLFITRADERTVTDDGFAVDSPYNTFMYAGLPPTPIGASGLDAVDAAAHPSAGDALYFLVDPETGAALLGATLHEHQLNAVELGLIEPEDVLPE